MNDKGFFISLEGGEYVGKTTQINKLVVFLRNFFSNEIVRLREPGGTLVSEKIRTILKDPDNSSMVPEAELLLFAAARAQLVRQVIRPALEKNSIVVCDRFVDSTIVYQGYVRGLRMGIIERINSIAIDTTMPDITFLLDADPAVTQKRMGPEVEKDRFDSEKQEFHRKIREGYKEHAQWNSHRIKTIDASLSQEEVHMEIRRLLNSHPKFIFNRRER